MNPHSEDPFWQEAYRMLKHGQDNSTITAHLLKKGADNETIAAIVDQLKPLRYAIRRGRGIKLILAGAGLLLLGFILTVVFFHNNQSIDYVMYGLTTIGIVILFWGVVEVLGL
jgi:hypothetical protein